MLSPSRWLPWLPSLRRAWKPIDFPTTAFPKIPSTQLIEEETLPDYQASRYYPVRLGEIFRQRYQLVGKLGFGASSTVWLARDLSHRRHVTIKLFIDSGSMGSQLEDEVNIYKRLERGPKRHPGYSAVRSLIDSFDIDGPAGTHRCLVHPPLFESVLAFLRRNPVERLPTAILAPVLKQLFFGPGLSSHWMSSYTYSDFEQQQLEDPCSRKEVDGRFIYESRQLQISPSKVGLPVLCDFGSAVVGDKKRTEDVQPDIYRAPEVVLQIPWGYEIDIWNAGCMIWDIFEGGHLFFGLDPEHNTYRSRTHISEMIALLGPPPQDLIARSKRSPEFFSDDGGLAAGMPIPNPITLEEIETNLEGKDKQMFLQLLRKMLQWEASKRSSAADLIEDEWIQKFDQT